MDRPLRLLGLDYGSKTVGVAATDDLGQMVHPVETIFRKRQTKLRTTLARIDEIVLERRTEGIVVGLPLNMDGSEGDRCEKTRTFAEYVRRRTGLPLDFFDERLTTSESDGILKISGVPLGERKQYIDQMAAVLILEGYINNGKSAFHRS